MANFIFCDKQLKRQSHWVRKEAQMYLYIVVVVIHFTVRLNSIPLNGITQNYLSFRIEMWFMRRKNLKSLHEQRLKQTTKQTEKISKSYFKAMFWFRWENCTFREWTVCEEKNQPTGREALSSWINEFMDVGLRLRRWRRSHTKLFLKIMKTLNWNRRRERERETQ